MNGEALAQNSDIQFDGSTHSKKEAIELLDKVLKEQSDFGVYGNLSDGVETLVKNMNIEIKTEKNLYFIDISPKDTSGGHDFSFTIDSNTQKMSGSVFGQVSPEPDFDN